MRAGVGRCLALCLGVATLLAAGCGPSSQPVVPGSGVVITDPGRPVVYAAVGASETVGSGADNRTRDAWPQVFYATALPRAATFFNVGVPAETTAAALDDELPRALAAHPDVVTVWLNVDDLAFGVTPAQYGVGLSAMVHALRRGGQTRVLVANTPVLSGLPVYAACRATAEGGSDPAGISCPLPGARGVTLPGPAEVDGLVDAYNAQVARVVHAEGAELVDLHARGDVEQSHPEWVSKDGFHPSSAGHASIAAAFAAVYRMH